MDFTTRPRPTSRGYKLERCDRCGVPLGSCICNEVPSIDHKLDVCVVLHQLERRKPTSSGKFTGQILARAQLVARAYPDNMNSAPDPEVERFILFPSEDSEPIDRCAALKNAKAPVLVIPDATWTQARRMLRRDPWVKDAMCVRLPDTVRPHSGLRSTLEQRNFSTLYSVARAFGAYGELDTELALLRAMEIFEKAHWSVRGQLVKGDLDR